MRPSPLEVGLLVTIAVLLLLVATVSGLYIRDQEALTQLEDKTSSLQNEVSSLWAQEQSGQVASNNETIALGLHLSASENATVLTQGEAIGVTASLYNSLGQNLTLYPDYSDYSNYSSWGGYSYNVCVKGLAVNMAVFAGIYSPANVTGATPLQVAEPYPIPCAIYVPITEYVFRPQSSVAEVYQNYTPQGLPSTYEQNITFTLTPFEGMPVGPVSGTYSGGGTQDGATGYWTGSWNDQSLQFQPFPVGSYTVVVSDMWGQMQFLYFEVA